MLHLFSMKRFLVIVLVLIPTAALAQGVRMSADFLPLEVGNRWVYEIVNEKGEKTGDLDFSVQQYVIMGGRSFYVLTRFPFVPEGTGAVKLVRYDRQERQYTRMVDNDEGALFLADGATTEVIQADPNGLPQKFRLRMDLIDLTFQRGVGIVEAQMRTEKGIQTARLTNVSVGSRGNSPPAVARNTPPPPPPQTPAQKSRSLIENVATVSEQNPVLDVQAVPVSEGRKFILSVINTEDKLLPLNFNSGQSYDFAVLDAVTGQEVWRWSRRMFFSQVLRQETIRPMKEWKFEVTWNHRDNDLNPLPAGKYKVIGSLATQPAIESEPLSFEIQ
jgi:hypothetical protein